jgi:hypothetical protein
MLRNLKGMGTGLSNSQEFTNLAEFSKAGCGSKKAVVPIIIIPIIAVIIIIIIIIIIIRIVRIVTASVV